MNRPFQTRQSKTKFYQELYKTLTNLVERQYWYFSMSFYLRLSCSNSPLPLVFFHHKIPNLLLVRKNWWSSFVQTQPDFSTIVVSFIPNTIDFFCGKRCHGYGLDSVWWSNPSPARRKHKIRSLQNSYGKKVWTLNLQLKKKLQSTAIINSKWRLTKAITDNGFLFQNAAKIKWIVLVLCIT